MLEKLVEKRSFASPLTNDAVFSMGVNDEVLSGDCNWLELFPPGISTLKNLMLSPTQYRRLKYFYCFAFVFICIGVILDGLSENGLLHLSGDGDDSDDESDSPSTAFMIFFLVLYFAYLLLPFYFYPVLQEIFKSRNITNLFEDAIALSSKRQLSLKFYAIFAFDVAITVTAMIVYISLGDFAWLVTFYNIFWFVVYILPMSILFALVVCILETYRIQSSKFVESLIGLKKKLIIARRYLHDLNLHTESIPGCGDENDHESPVNDDHFSRSVLQEVPDVEQNPDYDYKLLCAIRKAMETYSHLHDSTRHTSDKWGIMLMFVFLLPFTVIVSAIWSIYEDFFTVASTMGHIIMASFFLLQIGIMLSITNEAGNLVCRDLSSLLLRALLNSSQIHLSSASVNEISGFVSCMMYVKIEIPFFGNFTLRTRTLIAIVGSLVGAAIPAIIRNVL